MTPGVPSKNLGTGHHKQVTILGASGVLVVVGASDSDLVTEIERIYRDRYTAMCRLAAGVTGRVETAREAVQDGFAVALARRQDFRGDGSLEGWIGRIVLRAALDTRRRPAPDPIVLDEPGREALLWTPELPHADRDPALAAAVEGLPRRQRQVVFLRYFADLTHAQVAELLGISPNTVSALLHQARTALARRLEHEDAHAQEVQR
jgi:RNA polymerase sigma factor (sigma-70 family)